jgi:uncharacterized protein (TIGR03083 family)
MAAVAVGRSTLLSEIEEYVGRLLTVIDDLDDVDRPMPGFDWTIGETLRHLIAVYTGFAASIYGGGEMLGQYVPDIKDFRQRLANTNLNTMALVAPAPKEELARQLSERFMALRQALAEADPAAICATPWYGPGQTRTPDMLAGLALGEVTIHGLDIARASHVKWPISPECARMIIGSVFTAMLPSMVSADIAEAMSFDVQIRGGGPRFVVRLANGVAAVAPHDGEEKADCVISGEPVTFLLLGYGRVSQQRAILSGRVLAWGRKPWQALSFNKAFPSP